MFNNKNYKLVYQWINLTSAYVPKQYDKYREYKVENINLIFKRKNEWNFCLFYVKWILHVKYNISSLLN
jgi:hypothetical protein